MHITEIDDKNIRSIVGLILTDDNGNVGEIATPLFQDFKKQTNAFTVRHADGQMVRVTIRQEEI